MLPEEVALQGLTRAKNELLINLGAAPENVHQIAGGVLSLFSLIEKLENIVKDKNDA